MNPYLKIALTGLLVSLPLMVTSANTGRRDISFSQHMNAVKVQNQFGYTYRYRKQQANKPAYQYREQNRLQSGQPSNKRSLKRKSN